MYNRTDPRIADRPAYTARGERDKKIEMEIFASSVLAKLNIARDEIQRLDDALVAVRQNLAAREAELIVAQEILLRKTGEIDVLQPRVDKLILDLDEVRTQHDRITKELKTANQNFSAIKQELETANASLITTTTERDALQTQVDQMTSDLAEKQTEIEARSQAIAKVFREQADEIAVLHATETKKAKESAEATAKKINHIRNRLKLANRDKIKYKKDIILLDNELELLEHLRKQAFISRAIETYIRNMKKIDTYGGDFEVQAIANIFKMDIKIWQNNAGAYSNRLIKASTISAESSPAMHFNILAIVSEEDDVVIYQPMLPTFNNDISQIYASIVSMPSDANCLFGACIRSMQISQVQNIATHLDNKYLSIAAYSLRLEVCDQLSRNNVSLYNIFESIIDKITFDEANTSHLSIQQEAEQASEASIVGLNSVYSTIETELSKTSANTRLIANICKLIEQHYPEFADERVRATSNVGSISSNSSLGDGEDFIILGNTSDVALNFTQHDAAIRQFFMGVPGALETDMHAGNRNLSIAQRYLAAIKDEHENDDEEEEENNIGGPIELQALAEIYNWHIHLKAFKGSHLSGDAQYVNEFKQPHAKNSTELLYIALINACTPNAKFVLLSRRGYGIIDIESGSEDNIYAICKDITGKTIVELRSQVYSHLEKKVKSVSYDPFAITKSNDGISAYFDDYIFKGYKGVGYELKEFDLLPVADLLASANELRAMRKTIFKVSNAIIEKMSSELAIEMQEWSMPLNALTRYNDLHIIPAEGYKAIPPISMLLSLCSLGTLTANAVISENFTSTEQETYNNLQYTSLTTNFIGSLIYCLNNYVKQKNRSRVIRAVQDALIINLPFDKLETASIRLHRTDQKIIDPHTIQGFIFDQVSLRDEWARDIYCKVSFKIKGVDQEFFITKEAYIELRDKFRNNYATPALLLLMTVYIILTPLTIANVNMQIHSHSNTTSEDADASSNETPTNVTQGSFSSPATANASIAFAAVTSATILLYETERFGPKRGCEHELSSVLNAIKNTYAGNQGVLSDNLSTLLQYFNVSGVLADSLTTIPQMVNIQKSIFNAKQDLKLHIANLQERIKTTNIPDDSTEKSLLRMLERIISNLEATYVETLHENSKALSDLTKSIELVTDEVKGISPAITESVEMGPNRRSGVHFSPRRSLSNSLHKLSGLLKFSAATVDKKDGKLAGPNNPRPSSSL